MVKYLVKNTCASQKIDLLVGLDLRGVLDLQLLQAHSIHESGPIQHGVHKISAFAKDSFCNRQKCCLPFCFAHLEVMVRHESIVSRFLHNVLQWRSSLNPQTAPSCNIARAFVKHFYAWCSMIRCR